MPENAQVSIFEVEGIHFSEKMPMYCRFCSQEAKELGQIFLVWHEKRMSKTANLFEKLLKVCVFAVSVPETHCWIFLS